MGQRVYIKTNQLVRPMIQYQAFVHAAAMAAKAGDLRDCARYVLAAMEVAHFYPEIIEHD